MKENDQLSRALNHLIQGEAEEAISNATPWSESWVAKCIIYLAHAFFNYDIVTAMDVYGGPEALIQLTKSKSVESYFLKGYGALFKKEDDLAESAFKSAIEILPTDPFVQFSLAIIYMKRGKRNELFGIVNLMRQQNAGHPLFLRLKDVISPT